MTGGIAGLIQLDGRKPDHDAVERMLKSAWHRCQGGTHILSAGPAVLGCSVTHAGQLQAASASCGSLLVVCDARIDNADDLAIQLGAIAGTPLFTPAVLILTAYEKWGEDCAARFLGDFAFALWDDEEQKLLCARDHLGVRTLYYQLADAAFKWASELRQLRAGTHKDVRIEEQYIADFLLDRPLDGTTTVWQGLQRIPHGCHAVLRHGSLQVKRYWDLAMAPEIRHARTEDYAQQFEALLLDSVKRRTKVDGPVGATLSGGLDSSSVVSIAAFLRERQEGMFSELRTFSLVYDMFKVSDERKYFQTVVDRYGLRSVHVCADRLTPGRRFGGLVMCDEPAKGAHYDLWIALARAARDEGVRVVLTGNFGDHLFTGNPYYLFDFLKEFRWNRIARDLAAWGGYAGPTVVLWLIVQVLLGPVIPAPLKRVWRTVRRTDLSSCALDPAFCRRWKSPGAAVPKRLPGWRMGRWHLYKMLTHHTVRTGLWHDHSIGLPLGIEMRHPLMDYRLAELALGVPGECHLRPGYTKNVLRSALHNILPAQIRERQTKTNLVRFLAAGTCRERGRLARMMDGMILERLGVTSRDRFEPVLDRYCSGADDLQTVVWNILELEAWLRQALGEGVPGMNL